MFWNKRKIEIENEIAVLEAKRDSLKTKLELEEEISDLKISVSELNIEHDEALAQIKQNRKIADEDIKHMVKMKEERMGLEQEKKFHECEKERDTAVALVKDQYRDKMEERLKTETTQIKEMYGQILKRLPNVNVRMKGDI